MDNRRKVAERDKAGLPRYEDLDVVAIANGLRNLGRVRAL